MTLRIPQFDPHLHLVKRWVVCEGRREEEERV